ncbi:MAG: hypothetical protein Roseis2KO_29740 [Roseivirga sp.]
MSLPQFESVKRTLLLPALLLFFQCNPVNREGSDNWCDQELRAQFTTLSEVATHQNWFKVYEVGDDVYAIAEPYNFQEIISYLILGTEKALLFDTGMGLSSISNVVKELTELPIVVLNSHTHYDHIGGNHEFDQVLAMNHPYTQNRADKGLSHSVVQHEVTTDALCLNHLPGLDTAGYHIKPFAISEYIAGGSTIDIGGRSLEVIAVPGHTPDAIALLDEANGYLWTGDTFYEAPIWLFDLETDLKIYQQSIEKLGALASRLKAVFPAHNTPVASPERLPELVTAFSQVLSGKKKAVNSKDSDHASNDALLFEFEHFSFMIRKDLLK